MYISPGLLHVYNEVYKMTPIISKKCYKVQKGYLHDAASGERRDVVDGSMLKEEPSLASLYISHLSV